MKILCCLGYFLHKPSVRHLLSGSDSELETIYGGSSVNSFQKNNFAAHHHSLSYRQFQTDRDLPRHPSIWIRKEIIAIKLTSPQTYTGKCFENMAEVLRIWRPGNSSHSFKRFLSPDYRHVKRKPAIELKGKLLTKEMLIYALTLTTVRCKTDVMTSSQIEELFASLVIGLVIVHGVHPRVSFVADNMYGPCRIYG